MSRHFQWEFKHGGKSRGAATFLGDACRYGGAPIIWAEVCPANGGCVLTLWGVRLGDHPDYTERHSRHEDWVDAHAAAEAYAVGVRSRFLHRILADLDSVRGSVMHAISTKEEPKP